MKSRMKLPRDSIIRSTLFKMAGRIAIVIIAVTAISYFHMIGNLKVQALEQLEKYVLERDQREQAIFGLAEDNHAVLKKHILEALTEPGDIDSREEFDRLFVKHEDGITRNRPETFDGLRQNPGQHLSRQLAENLERGDKTMPGPKPINLLLVEDDEVDVMTVRRAFEKAGTPVAIAEAKDGHEALALLRGATLPEPLIILLDLNMPRMNGLEFLQKLRQDPQLESENVFILTTSKADEDRLAAYSFKISGYIIKTDAEDYQHNLVTTIDYYWADLVALAELEQERRSATQAPRLFGADHS